MNSLAMLAVFNIICLPIVFVIAIVKRKLVLLIPFIIIQLAWIITGPEYLTYRAGGGFGLGTLVTFISMLFLLISILVFLIGGGMVFSRFQGKSNEIRWYLGYTAGSIVLCFLMGVPLLVSKNNTKQCNQLNQEEINGIVKSLNTYRTEHGDYPEELDMLVPTYLSSLPVPHCFENYGDLKASKGFGESATTSVKLPIFVKCGNFITIPVITYGWLQRYDLETNEWSRISFLDVPECYHKSLGWETK